MHVGWVKATWRFPVKGKTFGEGILKGESNTFHIWGSIDRRKRRRKTKRRRWSERFLDQAGRKLQQKIWTLSSDHRFFLRQPFSTSTDGRWPAGAKKASIVEPYVQMGILEMVTSDLLEEHHMDAAVSESSRCSPSCTCSSHHSLQWIPSRPWTEKHAFGECLGVATTEYWPDIRTTGAAWTLRD